MRDAASPAVAAGSPPIIPACVRYAAWLGLTVNWAAVPCCKKAGRCAGSGWVDRCTCDCVVGIKPMCAGAGTMPVVFGITYLCWRGGLWCCCWCCCCVGCLCWTAGSCFSWMLGEMSVLAANLSRVAVKCKTQIDLQNQLKLLVGTKYNVLILVWKLMLKTASLVNHLSSNWALYYGYPEKMVGKMKFYSAISAIAITWSVATFALSLTEQFT